MVKEESGEGLVDERGFELPAFLVVPRTQQSPSHVKSKTRSGRQIPPLRGPTRHNSARKRKSGRSGRNDKFEVVYGWWTRGDSNPRLPRCERCRKTHKMRCCNHLRLLVPDSNGQLGQVRSRVLVVPLEGPTLKAGGVLAPELCLLPAAFLDYCRSDSEGHAVPRLSPGVTDLVSHEPAEPAAHSLQS
jgi:hypothetical protein